MKRLAAALIATASIAAAPQACSQVAGHAALGVSVTELDAVIKGDTVREVLQYVDYNPDMLVAKLRTDVEAAVRERRMSFEESGRLLKFYEDGLHGYTYLEDAKG